MKLSISAAARLLVILPLAAMAAESTVSESASDLPVPVAEAIAAGNCDQLIALNKQYHAEPASPARDAVTRALEDAVLALPSCGTIDVGLVRVEPLRGVNFFDRESPLGSTAAGR